MIFSVSITILAVSVALIAFVACTRHDTGTTAGRTKAERLSCT